MADSGAVLPTAFTRFGASEYMITLCNGHVVTLIIMMHTCLAVCSVDHCLTQLCCAADEAGSEGTLYDLAYASTPFSFTVSRKGALSNAAAVFNTTGQRLVFKVNLLPVELCKAMSMV